MNFFFSVKLFPFFFNTCNVFFLFEGKPLKNLYCTHHSVKSTSAFVGTQLLTHSVDARPGEMENVTFGVFFFPSSRHTEKFVHEKRSRVLAWGCVALSWHLGYYGFHYLKKSQKKKLNNRWILSRFLSTRLSYSAQIVWSGSIFS